MERCRSLATALPAGAAFSHVTAARLLGATVPAVGRADAVDVTAPSIAATPAIPSLRWHAAPLADDVRIVHGMPVTSPARTWADLAAALSLGDLVALGDHLVQWREPLVELDELDAAIDPRSHHRGARRARRALELVDGLAQSAAESVLRVLLVEAGLPRPDVSYTRRPAGGAEAFRLDLVYPRERVVVQYEECAPRSRDEWRAEMARRGALANDGWSLVEVSADELRRPHEVAARIAFALARRAQA